VKRAALLLFALPQVLGCAAAAGGSSSSSTAAAAAVTELSASKHLPPLQTSTRTGTAAGRMLFEESSPSVAVGRA
jgi:hypothetical protein